uniref:Cytochrome c oxidase subunit 2 n=1 Tax=Oniscus asellus TaxID=96861 RepID=A0A1P8DKE2_ONIAS|nr:cytochrome oxidase subunit 2 [Oniscus asellus]
MAWWKSVGLQDGNSPLMEQLIFFHDYVMIVLVMVTAIVGYAMLSLLMNNLINRSLLENQSIELIWTILPALVLLFIAFPSLRLLYLLDEISSPEVTVKVVGHQWYWSYEYSDFKKMEFDSYMLPASDLNPPQFRSLEVDNRVVIPYKTQMRVLITAADVIHSWTIPGLGVKVDAVPGRLNQLSIFSNRPGVLYGQCSEICGANHSFMPISLEMVSTKQFMTWLLS